MVPRSILVAFDFSDPSRRALEWARMLRARLHASVAVVHVHDPTGFGALRAERARDDQARRAQSLEDELRREVAAVFGPEEQAVRVHVVTGNPDEDLAELALELGADLVVAGSTGKGAVDRVLMGSVTEELVRRSAIPVMIVH